MTALPAPMCLHADPKKNANEDYRMNTDIKKLQDKRAAAVTEMQRIVDAAKAEDRGLSADELQNWNNCNDQIEALEKQIDVTKRTNSLVAQVAEAQADMMRGNVGSHAVEAAQEQSGGDYASTFDAFMRGGMDALTNEQRGLMRENFQRPGEQRAQSVGTDSAGGYTVPEGFSGEIEKAMAAFQGIRNAARVISTSTGNTLPWPTVDDTSNTGALLAENTQDSEQDVTFGEVSLGAYKYTSKIVRVSVELLQDSAFNMDQFLAEIFGERLGRITATAYATGTGSSQPNGLVTAATLGKTAASATAITYNELLDLKHSVDPAYRNNATWAFNDSTLKAIKQLQDSNGLPLWQPSIMAEVPATLDGDPYVIDQNMASIATTAKTVLYGNFQKYLIRDVKGFTMVRLVERYADYHQVGFVAFMRTDADLLDAGTAPVKYLAQA